ncbi:hypothetical protein BGZ98_007487, partial [Dissophora globulifera]
MSDNNDIKLPHEKQRRHQRYQELFAMIQGFIPRVQSRADLHSWVHTIRNYGRPDLRSWISSRRKISDARQQWEEDKKYVQLTALQEGMQNDSTIAAATITTGASTKEYRRLQDSCQQKDCTSSEKILAEGERDKHEMNCAFDMTHHDTTALLAITAISLVVRLWRISWPDEVVSHEAHVGKMVNRYLTGEFAFDVHPPLATLIMAGISFLSRYNGAFAFDEIGDPYPGSVPYASMRLSMALMGALCAPMAYVTLKATGQSAPTAMFASTMIIFDNALTANNSLMNMDAPLMFFVSATTMNWSLLARESHSYFSFKWWVFLLATGISMTGAMSVKLAGVLSVVMVGFFTLSQLYSLAVDVSVSAVQWLKHFAARVVALMIVPFILYTALFQLHFNHQKFEPADLTTPHAEYDLGLLSKSFRHTLLPKNSQSSPQDVSWSDIVYGSVVQLQNEDSSSMYLHSFDEMSPEGSKQQQLSGYEYSDINTHWIVIRAGMDDEDQDEIPTRLQYLRNGELIRLRHVSTRNCLHSHSKKSFSSRPDRLLHEVTAYGSPGFDGDFNDWWIIETVDAMTGQLHEEDNEEKVKALETTFRLRHAEIGCYLFATGALLPDPWGLGRQEIACHLEASIRPKSIWRFTMNKHDYLPFDTPVASYKQLTYWQKFWEIHRIMWTHIGLDQSAATAKAAASHPIWWPL